MLVMSRQQAIQMLREKRESIKELIDPIEAITELQTKVEIMIQINRFSQLESALKTALVQSHHSEYV